MVPILAHTIVAPMWGSLGVLAHLPLGTRVLLAVAISFLLALLCGPRCIGWLKAHCREPNKSPSADIARLHASKRDTPTMGGLFLIAGWMLALLCVADCSDPLVILVLVSAAALAVLGATDDWVKLRTTRHGLSARTKLAAQVVIALAAASVLVWLQEPVEGFTKLNLPLVGSLDIGWYFVPWAALVMVGSSNAVNLTDGLDGLAGGCLVCAGGALAILAYVSGDSHWAQTLGVNYLPQSAEMAVVLGGLLGGLFAFLRFNCHPAAVFMGDAGSLPLGGLLGLVAVIVRQEIVFVIIAGVFVVEALSVIVQVASFRTTQRRLLRCAPLHHHFQLLGWAEEKIVWRFWAAAGLCAVAGVYIAMNLPGSPQTATFSEIAEPSQSSLAEVANSQIR